MRVVCRNPRRIVGCCCLSPRPDPRRITGWQDGARLSVRFRAAKATFAEVVDDIVEMNPGVTREKLMRGVEVDPEDASRVEGDVDWDLKGIKVLPESIGDLTVGGGLYLGSNNLATLPASFGSLQVGKRVFLNDNPVAASGPHFDGLDLVLEDHY